MKTLKLVSFGHRECIGKKAEAKEANRVSANCAICAGLTDFGGLGRYAGQNKAPVGAFNGPVVCSLTWELDLYLIFLARSLPG
jgi:hypothetical protein